MDILRGFSKVTDTSYGDFYIKHIDNFDSEFYLNIYSDLINKGITKETAIFHWIHNGYKEGNICSKVMLDDKMKNIQVLA